MVMEPPDKWNNRMSCAVKPKFWFMFQLFCKNISYHTDENVYIKWTEEKYH